MALLLVVLVGATRCAMSWNRERVAPAPGPTGDRSVGVHHAGWGDVYLPAGTDTLPTLLFSPGLGQDIAPYRTYLTDIASHGFLIVAVPYPPLKIEDNADFIPALPRIAAGLTAVMDRIDTGADSLLRRADRTRVATIGHSFGGAAAATACIDRRIKAAVDLDGSLYGPVVHQGVACPFLLIERALSRADTLDSPVWYEERSQGRLHEDSLITHSTSVTWKTIDKLDHMSFTDPALAFTTGNWFKEAMGRRLNAARAQRITADLTIEFLRTHLGPPTK